MRYFLSQLLNPLRQRLDQVDIQDPQIALLVYRLIPAQCPFARTVKIFDHTLFTIPPLCKLNPVYEELMALRFRAMCYLVDECGMTI